jgi:Icc-related predicted phosphoesterase/uncharacterized protein YprB with RNaseH-like and TPR domain
MRLLCFSDWRVQPINDIYRFLDTLDPKPDYILYAGDDIGRFQQDGVNHFSELANYSIQHCVIAVAGNDDIALYKTVLAKDNVHDAHDNVLVSGDFVFVGLEGSTRGPGLLHHSELEVKSHLNKQLLATKGKKIIVLSHAPPRGVLDLGIRFATPGQGAEHIGSSALRDFIDRIKPLLVVCGHCHSQGGLLSCLGSTRVLNIASHDSAGAAGNFAIVDIGTDGSLGVSQYSTEDLIPKDSLLNIHGVGPSVEQAFSQSGIKTIEHLLNAPDLYKIAESSGLPFATVSRIKAKAKAHTEGKPFKLKDMPSIPDNVIFFDIETDIACERVWLVGTYSKAGFKRFYADSWEDEKSMLQDFLNFLIRNPNFMLISFSGINFDRNVIEKALRRLNLDYKSFLSFRHKDLALQIKECFIFSNQSYALKDLASHIGYKFKYPELDGFQVALEYHHHIIDKIPLNPMLFDYNEDDVKSLPFMIQQLTKLNQECISSSIGEIAITDRQKNFREFIGDLKKQGVSGEKYREKVAEWNRTHK